jgi:hypothetical protein
LAWRSRVAKFTVAARDQSMIGLGILASRPNHAVYLGAMP